MVAGRGLLRPGCSGLLASPRGLLWALPPATLPRTPGLQGGMWVSEGRHRLRRAAVAVLPPPIDRLGDTIGPHEVQDVDEASHAHPLRVLSDITPVRRTAVSTAARTRALLSRDHARLTLM